MAEDSLIRPSVRAFLAISLCDIFSEEIGLILRPLCHRMTGVKWIDPCQAHLTLHFFGSISREEIERIDDSMKKIASRFAPFELRIDKIGGFPDLRRPNIVWLGLEEKTGELLLFQRILQSEIEQLGFQIETKPFHPHVTIGRVKKRGVDLGSLLTTISFKFPASEKSADHFVLYQSHCLPAGARYEVLKNYPLSKKA